MSRGPELPLFDLPLRGEDVGREETEPHEPTPAEETTEGTKRRSPRPAPAPAPAENLLLFDDEDPSSGGEDVGEETESEEPSLPRLTDRFLAGLADLAVQALALGAGAIGALWLGATVDERATFPLAGLLGAFSFLYWVIPLAFWGRTPGMAWVGHAVRDEDGGPLSFGQAARRWTGALLTLGLVGIPQLLALGGRSLSDHLSGSWTVLADESEAASDDLGEPAPG